MKLPFKVTYKTYMFSVLLILKIIGVFKNGIWNTLPQLLIALITTITLDVSLNYIKEKTFILPDSATISAFFIATALAVNQPWFVPFVAASIAILAKHFIRVNGTHIFNPGVFGLFCSILIFNAQIQWWAAQYTILVIIGGLFITYK